MKRILLYLAAFLALINLSTAENSDRNSSPYFLLASGHEVANFTLLKTNVKSVITGVCADVTVEQVYVNKGSEPTEGLYVFPASTKSAVYAMSMFVGERELKAVCKRKEAARQEYETAKKEGKRASLLEQFKPNVFQMNVANIAPGDTIKTVMKYVENIAAEAGEYEFVYPTVVGPRYSNQNKDNDKFVVNANNTGKSAVLNSEFNIEVEIVAGMKFMQVYSNSHKIDVEYGSRPDLANTSAKIKLDKGETNFGKDFILKYSFTDFNLQTGLLMNKNQDENYFMLTLQPPVRVENKNIPPREYIFILDVSGSMSGFPLEISKKTILDIIDGLRAEDKFNIIFFAGASESMFCESVNANDIMKTIAKNKINSANSGGGTELLTALKTALAVKKSEGFSRTVAILTDGYVTVEEEAFDFIKNNLGDGNFFALGIGSSVNRFLIEGLARVGKGEAFIADKSETAKEVADKFNIYIRNPIMTDIKFESSGILIKDVIPASIPDLFADRPIIVYGKYEGQAGGTITVSGNYMGKRIKVDMPVLKFAEFDESQSIKYFWVRNKIAELDDYSGITARYPDKLKKIEEEVTNLGEKYNLLTKFTSFVAVDYETEKAEVKPAVSPKKMNKSPNNTNSNENVNTASVVVIASQKSKVDATTVGSVRTISSEELQMNPLLGMSSGVVNSGDGFGIRGNRESSSEDTKKMTIEYEVNSNGFNEVDNTPNIDGKKIIFNAVFPEMAKRATIRANMTVKVKINKLGFAYNYEVVKSDAKMLDSLALELIKSLGKLGIVTRKGRPVNYSLYIPLHYTSANVTWGKFKIEVNDEDLIEIDSELDTNTTLPHFDLTELIKAINLPNQYLKGDSIYYFDFNLLINKNGGISKYQIIQSDAPQLNEYLIRGIQNTKFTPAYQMGNAISSRFSIVFKISQIKGKLEIISKDRMILENIRRKELIDKLEHLKELIIKNFDYSDYILQNNSYPTSKLTLNLKYDSLGVCDTNNLIKNCDSQYSDHIRKIISQKPNFLNIDSVLLVNTKSNFTIDVDLNSKALSPENIRIDYYELSRKSKAKLLKIGDKVNLRVFLYKNNCLQTQILHEFSFKYRCEPKFWILENIFLNWNVYYTHNVIDYKPYKVSFPLKYISHLFPDINAEKDDKIELEVYLEIAD